MNNTLFCHKLQKEAPALSKPPFPGPLGEKIFQEISQQAWSMWLSHQTMLINEYRLQLNEPKSKEFLQKEMQAFLFGEGSQKPAGYVAKE